MRTTPATMAVSPMKSKSRTCSLQVLPWCGLRLRKKKSKAKPTPPVGLLHARVKTLFHTDHGEILAGL